MDSVVLSYKSSCGRHVSGSRSWDTNNNFSHAQKKKLNCAFSSFLFFSQIDNGHSHMLGLFQLSSFTRDRVAFEIRNRKVCHT